MARFYVTRGNQPPEKKRGRKPNRQPKKKRGKQRWCICKKKIQSSMIGCDNSNCPFEWMHYCCMGIEAAPTGKFFCFQCRLNRNTHWIPKPGVVELVYNDEDYRERRLLANLDEIAHIRYRESIQRQ